MSNEEKILSMLENLTGTVEKHSKMFENLNNRMDQMQADMGEMQKTLTRVAVTQENIVLPKLQLLAEGHDTLLNTLARKERVEALEDDVALLKTVIKAMSQRIENLEKAQ